MDTNTHQRTEPRAPQSPQARHALYAQGMQVVVILCVIGAVLMLTLYNKMSGDVSAGILGAIVGHAGSTAIRAAGVRSQDTSHPN